MKAPHQRGMSEKAIQAAIARSAKPSKYRNVRTRVGGTMFDSKREAKRWQDLQYLQLAGTIRNLKAHPRYTLFALTLDHADIHDANSGTITIRRQPVCEYEADYEYELCLGSVWALTVEDSKGGVRTAMYLLKRKLFEAQFGLKILET